MFKKKEELKYWTVPFFSVSFLFLGLQRLHDWKPSWNSPHILASRLSHYSHHGAGTVFAGWRSCLGVWGNSPGKVEYFICIKEIAWNSQVIPVLLVYKPTKGCNKFPLCKLMVFTSCMQTTNIWTKYNQFHHGGLWFMLSRRCCFFWAANANTLVMQFHSMRTQA